MKIKTLFLILVITFTSYLSIQCNRAPSEGTFLTVLSEKCTGCRKCVKVCVVDAVAIFGNKAVIDLAKCTKCLRCIDICPYDAIE